MIEAKVTPFPSIKRRAGKADLRVVNSEECGHMDLRWNLDLSTGRLTCLDCDQKIENVWALRHLMVMYDYWRTSAARPKTCSVCRKRKGKSRP